VKQLLLSIVVMGLCALPASAAGVPVVGDQLIQHLEYLGYTCTVENKAQKDKAYVVADHEEEYRFTFMKLAGGIVFRTLFTLNADKKKEWGEAKILQAINTANADSALLKVYLFEDGETVALEAWQSDVYEKRSFSSFLDLYRGETLKYVVQGDLGDVIN
jgi:hypothetical protein